MSESIKSIKCPHCGSSLELQDGLDTFFCLYCGGKVTLTGLSDAAYEAKVKIKEMEHQERLKDKEYEFKKHSDKFNNKLLVCILLFWIVLLAISIIVPEIKSKQAIAQLTQIESELEQAIINEDYDLALIKANQLRCDDNLEKAERKKWDEKRESYIQLINSRQKENANPPPT